MLEDGDEMESRSEVIEQPDDVGEVDPAVVVAVEHLEQLVLPGPGQLVEGEADFGDVLSGRLR